MDRFFAWLQEILGPVSYGSLLGFVLQVVVFRPSSLILAGERAIAAVLLPMLLTRPFVPMTQKGLNLDQESATILIAGTCALCGVELVRVIRNRVLLGAAGKGGGRE